MNPRTHYYAHLAGCEACVDEPFYRCAKAARLLLTLAEAEAPLTAGVPEAEPVVIEISSPNGSDGGYETV